MKTFSLTGFAAHMAILAETKIADHCALDVAGQIVEDEAKRVIGTYDYGWEQLAESTQDQRGYLGYPDNEPLLRTGEMRDSIQHKASDTEVHIGSDNPKAEWQELGTRRIPPRSFLMGAAIHKAHEVVDAIGRTLVKHMEGEAVVPSAIYTPHNASWFYK